MLRSNVRSVTLHKRHHADLVHDEALGEHHPLVGDHDALDPPQDREHGEPRDRDQRQVERDVVDEDARREVPLRHHHEQQEQRRLHDGVEHVRPVLAHADDPTLGRQQVLVDLPGRQHGLRQELCEELVTFVAAVFRIVAMFFRMLAAAGRLREDQPDDERDKEEPDDPPEVHRQPPFRAGRDPYLYLYRTDRIDGIRHAGPYVAIR